MCHLGLLTIRPFQYVATIAYEVRHPVIYWPKVDYVYVIEVLSGHASPDPDADSERRRGGARQATPDGQELGSKAAAASAADAGEPGSEGREAPWGEGSPTPEGRSPSSAAAAAIGWQAGRKIATG